MTTRITKAINPPLLEEQLATYTGLVYQIHRNPTPEDSFFEWDDTLRTAQENSDITTIVNAHDHTQLSISEQIVQVEIDAITQAASIPNWATWDETTALNWFDTNIAGSLPVANLAGANAVLEDMATLQRNLVRMVIALRNKSFPNLQE